MSFPLSVNTSFKLVTYKRDLELLINQKFFFSYQGCGPCGCFWRGWVAFFGGRQVLEIDSSGLMYLGNAKAGHYRRSQQILKIINPRG